MKDICNYWITLLTPLLAGYSTGFCILSCWWRFTSSTSKIQNLCWKTLWKPTYSRVELIFLPCLKSLTVTLLCVHCVIISLNIRIVLFLWLLLISQIIFLCLSTTWSYHVHINFTRIHIVLHISEDFKWPYIRMLVCFWKSTISVHFIGLYSPNKVVASCYPRNVCVEVAV